MNATRKDYDLDDNDDKEQYDEHLDGVFDPVELGNLTFDPSKIIEELDPTAYRCGFNDYTDGLPERWICEGCDDEYDDKDTANDCCLEPCPECDKLYENETDAAACCEQSTE